MTKEEFIKEYKCFDQHGESCGDCMECEQAISEDLEELFKTAMKQSVLTVMPREELNELAEEKGKRMIVSDILKICNRWQSGEIGDVDFIGEITNYAEAQAIELGVDADGN